MLQRRLPMHLNWLLNHQKKRLPRILAARKPSSAALVPGVNFQILPQQSYSC